MVFGSSKSAFAAEMTDDLVLALKASSAAATPTSLLAASELKIALASLSIRVLSDRLASLLNITTAAAFTPFSLLAGSLSKAATALDSISERAEAF